MRCGAKREAARHPPDSTLRSLSPPQVFELYEADICCANSRLEKRKKCAVEFISVAQISKNL
jgi:hypothetical protein